MKARPAKIKGGREWRAIRIDGAIYDKLEKLAEQDGRSTANFLNHWLKRTLPREP